MVFIVAPRDLYNIPKAINHILGLFPNRNIPKNVLDECEVTEVRDEVPVPTVTTVIDIHTRKNGTQDYATVEEKAQL